jgi:hypothetical protein
MDLEERFRQAGANGAEFRGAPFWSWNDDLQPEELRRQVRLHKEAGLGGYFMHARIGLITPYLSERWMECIEATVDEGRKVGTASWLYDEDRWPSGSVGRVITDMGPEWRQKSIELLEATPKKFKPAENPLVTFLARRQGRPARPGKLVGLRRLPDHPPAGGPPDAGGKKVFHFYMKTHGYADTLSPRVVDKFIELTHEAYKKRVGADFGQAIPGVFTDEPNYRHVPWTEDLPAYFMQRNGYDLLEHLPSIFFEVGNWRKVRYDFWSAVTQRYVETFSKRLGEWCQNNRLAFTGHQLAEDTLSSQIHHIGAAMPHYEYMQAPGIDHLCRRLGSTLLVKQVSSAAHQMGGRRVLSETFGCSGWNVSFWELKWIAEWQYVLGVDLMCQHLELYSSKGCRKRDYPPSLYYQQPWWPRYKLFNDYFARLGALLTAGRHRCDILIIHPIGSAWAVHDPFDDTAVTALDEQFNRLSLCLLSVHRDYDYGDEMMIERRGRVEKDTFLIGSGRYKVVVVPASVSLRPKVVDMLRKFARGGGKLLCVSPLPTLENGARSRRLPGLLARKATVVDNDPPQIRKALLGMLAPDVIVLTQDSEDLHGRFEQDAGSVYYQLREEGQRRIVFLANTDLRNGVEAVVRVRGGGKVEEWDCFTGEIRPVPSTARGGYSELRMALAPGGSRLLVFDSSKPAWHQTPPKSVRARELSIAGPWKVVTSDPNALTLDYCRFRLDDGPWSEEAPVIWLYRRLREGQEEVGQVFGRWGYKPPEERKEPEKPQTLHMRFTFLSELGAAAQGPVYLVVEEPQRWKVSVNGSEVTADDDWWCDISFKKIEITERLVPGENVVDMSGPLTRDLEPESCYIIGPFTVVRKAERWPGGPPMFALAEPLTEVDGTDLTASGFPFYRGNAILRSSLSVEQREGKSCFFELDRPDAVLVRVAVNGKSAGWLCWPPWRVEVTDLLKSGENEIEVELFGSCRNLLGPHHHRDGELFAVGPGSFVGGQSWLEDPRGQDETWRHDYCFVPFGLKGKARLVFERAA